MIQNQIVIKLFEMTIIIIILVNYLAGRWYKQEVIHYIGIQEVIHYTGIQEVIHYIGLSKKLFITQV